MTKEAHESIIHKFYTSFQQLDHQGMMECYHDEIRFGDPVFPYLKKEEVGAMWKMLIEALKKNPDTWTLTFSNVVADDVEGSCRWEAQYNFSLTNRRVHNIITAKFHFRDGKIIEHTDYFDFYRWARMAFGLRGLLLGWTNFFKSKVQSNVNSRLKNFIQK